MKVSRFFIPPESAVVNWEAARKNGFVVVVGAVGFLFGTLILISSYWAHDTAGEVYTWANAASCYLFGLVIGCGAWFTSELWRRPMKKHYGIDESESK